MKYMLNYYMSVKKCLRGRLRHMDGGTKLLSLIPRFGLWLVVKLDPARRSILKPIRLAS